MLPVRSISLPSRLTLTSPTPEEKEEDEQNNRNTADSADEHVQTGLLRLTKSFNSMTSLVDHFPAATNHPHTRHQHYKMVEKALDKSVALLDVCCQGKDLICSMRGKVQVIQSALRKKGAESSVESHLVTYFLFRKSSSKDISKSIRAFTKQITRNETVSSSPIFIQEANAITINGLQYFSLLSTSPLVKTTLFRGHSSKPPKESEEEMNEAGCVDSALYSIHRQAKKGKDFKHELPMAQKKLESLGVFMDGLEDGLHGTYKFLIQYRASLLNSLT